MRHMPAAMAIKHWQFDSMEAGVLLVHSKRPTVCLVAGMRQPPYLLLCQRCCVPATQAINVRHNSVGT
jgi:hypothetical protein